MAVQVIVYSRATGRVRRVIDPEIAVVNALALLAQAKAGPGEAAAVYTKRGLDAQGNSLDQLPQWQAAITQLTQLTPANDRYCVIDAQNKILAAIFADPLCGDSIAQCTLVAHPTAGPGWTYDGQTFIAPVERVIVKTLPA